MKLIRPLAALIFLVPLFVGGAIAQDKGMSTMMGEMMPKPSDPPVVQAYKQTRMDMMKSMGAPLTGEADVDFARNMIPHHQAAIAMAKIELEHGKDPELKKMAEKMIADQEKEISSMKAWLAKHAK
jgi:uncharacterized protein (DUF305 family)